ncbi:MAG: hypothetical protein J5527_09785 [Treponema sp.]|nr:hypothetical protein [Treponema sp.]
MEDHYLGNIIRMNGSISAVSHSENEKNKYVHKDDSAEDLIGRITSLFLPYIMPDISDKNFMAIQNELKEIVSEIKEKTA